MRILFLARSLERGGAERQLVALANGLVRRGHEVGVALFYGGGSLEDDLDPAVELLHLGKSGRWDLACFCARLVCAVRRHGPEVLYSFLGGPNILAGMLRRFWPRTRMVWSVRASDMDYSHYDRAARLANWAEARLSGRADLIIANSRAGKRHAAARGMPEGRMVVIPNGIDTQRFAPDRESGAALRASWLPQGRDLLVGLVGRLDPMKDHETFLRAARLAADRDPGLAFVCVGGGESEYAKRVKALSASLDLSGGLSETLTWAGELDAMPLVYNSLDMCCLSSITEGFPNTVGEAMSCGVPCLVTDVGDAADIVGDAGLVAPRKNPQALGEALLRMAGLVRSGRAFNPRQRMVEHFSLEHMVDLTENVLAGREP